ncbi:heme-binding domain-containing protein [Leptospira idonii]|uniref:Heme-binding protein n=1 Tax=Leptospira idonii TaxID=1193500 RepID=A0A4R9LXR0_9LEPT|nr:heme-binding domain-containing protein [Leptospira idonii]TGN18472.1 heme-binding protein [Leptospira idonii]
MKRGFLIFIFCFSALQFLQTGKENPEEKNPLQASPEVISVLKKSCYDCHSNRTEWPLYSYIFPVSYFVKHHVDEGRDELNFSHWENLSPKKKATAAYSIIEEIEEGEMPLTSYTLIHRNAVLSEKEVELLKEWALQLEEESEKEN